MQSATNYKLLATRQITPPIKKRKSHFLLLIAYFLFLPTSFAAGQCDP